MFLQFSSLFPFSDIAHKRDLSGDLFKSDIGEGLPFRPNTIDAAISISAIQWLFNADFKEAIPKKRLFLFFQTLHHCLRSDGRAVLQFYPSCHEQINELHNCALKAGFGGGALLDYPNSTRNRKFNSVLFAS